MSKLKKVFKNVRVIIVLCALIMALVAIHPNPWAKGVVIKSVTRNSSAELAGFTNPKPNLAPMSREVILAMNNQPILSVADYYTFLESTKPNKTIQVRTTQGIYNILVREKLKTTTVNDTPETISLGAEDIGLHIDAAPTSNVRKGLDLQGGTRVLLSPVDPVSSETLELMVDHLKERLNVYGLSDLLITNVQDKPGFLGKGNNYILVEIAGASDEEVRELLSKQGKFEAKIGNTTVFKGGNDVTFVCRTADCSGIDPNRGCSRSGNEWLCGFQFSISLAPDAAQHQADATKGLQIIARPSGEGYLSSPLELYLDDVLVDSLNIAEDLQGRAVTEIAITGSGSGISQSDAMQDSLENMKKLQTVLITGSLPVRLEIVKIDAVSPVLGNEFLQNAWLVGLLATLSVTIVLMIAYRQLRIALPIMLTCLSEIFLMIGIAALVGSNIDLAAIAGIIIAVGTGVNDQIVIVDETLKKRREGFMPWKERLKQAFFIIFSAYFTVVAAMLPLLFAGAGLLKGFAVMTILGVSVGVFITRPAFAAIAEMMYGD